MQCTCCGRAIPVKSAEMWFNEIHGVVYCFRRGCQEEWNLMKGGEYEL